MWEIKGKPIEAKRFAPFEPLRVLNYYDGPRIFTFNDADDALCLACWSDEDEGQARFLVVAVTTKIIADLESGLLTVREALSQPGCGLSIGASMAHLLVLGSLPTRTCQKTRSPSHEQCCIARLSRF